MVNIYKVRVAILKHQQWTRDTSLIVLCLEAEPLGEWTSIIYLNGNQVEYGDIQ